MPKIFIVILVCKIMKNTMATQKSVRLNEKGMITLPSSIRKKHNWKEGDEFVILEIEGHLEIIPILNLDKLPKMNVHDFATIYEKSHDEELEIEK